MQQRNNFSKQMAASAVVVLLAVVVGVAMLRPATSQAGEKPGDANPDIVSVSDTGKQVAGIETAPVELSSTQDSLRTSGQVTFPSDLTVKVSPRLTGKVSRVFVRVGDRVKAGQTLAILESVDAATAQNTALQSNNKLILAKLSLDRAERLYKLGTPDVTSAEAALEQARASAEAAKDVLERTRQQATIGGFTQKPLEDAENARVAAASTLSQAQSDLALAQRDFDRKTKLVEIGVAAKSDLEASENALEKARINVEADQDSLKLAKQAVDREKKAFSTNLYADQQVEQSASAYRQAVLQVSAAERALRLAKASILRDLEQARSDYQAAQFDDQNARHALDLLGHPAADGSISITSPITGIVTERDVSDGQVVDQSQMTPWQMFVVSDDRTVWVETDVYEKDIANVSVGDPVTIAVAALPNRLFKGTIKRLAPTLDAKSRAVKVQAEIANEGGLLRDGEYAEVTISLGNPGKGLLIPQTAAVHDAGIDYVYVEQGGKYAKRKVKLGAQKGNRWVVENGLKEGEQIVTHGALFLGSQVSDD